MLHKGKAGRTRRTMRCGLILGAIVLAKGAAAQRLSLHDAVQQAMASPGAQAAAAQVDEAKGQLRQAGLGLNPRLFLQSEDFRPWSSGFDFANQTENYAFVSQTFEVDGKRHKRIAVATAQLQQARSSEEFTRQMIAARVAAAYWNAAVSDRVVLLLQGDMTAVNDMVRYHQERVDAGAMRGVDLLRMEIERGRLQVTLLSAQRDAEQARLELFKQMGTPPFNPVELTDNVDTLGTITPVPVDLVLANRADLQAARDAVAAAQADVKLQRANGVPDLDLIGGYKRNDADNTGYGSLQMPLPFRNRNQGEIERAKAGVVVAQKRLDALALQVRAEVAQGEANYRREGEIVGTVLPDMRAKARQNLQLMTEAYRIGGVDLLRYLDAERTEFDVEVNALRTLAEYQQAALRLQLSYGVTP